MASRGTLLVVCLGLAVTAMVACNDATGPGWEERPGVLQFIKVAAGTGDARLENPTVITVGTPLEITVASGGSSSCTRPGPVVSTANSSGMTIQVFDFRATGAQVCTRDLVIYERVVFQTFFLPGEKTIRAVGEGDDLVYVVTVAGTATPHR